MPDRIIYDFGSNNGDDLAYYLLKADKVVAVEANPLLANQIRQRFAQQIDAGRLHVEACALTAEASVADVPFFVHKTSHVESQFPRPEPNRIHLFDQITVPSTNVVELIRRHGDPHYVKVDIEHYDQVILRAIFSSSIFPPYISAESHSIEVFALLITVGGYQAFKMVEGRNVHERYRNALIQTDQGPARYSFPPHSAGPFGQDVAGPWMTMNNFFRVLSIAGLGWRDIHASRVDAPDPAYLPRTRVELKCDF